MSRAPAPFPCLSSFHFPNGEPAFCLSFHSPNGEPAAPFSVHTVPFSFHSPNGESAFRLSSHTPNGESASRQTNPNRNLTAIFRTALAPILLLLTGCHQLPPPTPLDQLTAQQREGYEVFQTRCAVCHYERTDQPKQGPSLIGLYKKPYLPSGAPANDDRITDTILHGHGLMPAQPNLDPDALNALLAYLHTV